MSQNKIIFLLFLLFTVTFVVHMKIHGMSDNRTPIVSEFVVHFFINSMADIVLLWYIFYIYCHPLQFWTEKKAINGTRFLFF